MTTAVEQHKENGPAEAEPKKRQSIREYFEELDEWENRVVIPNMRKMIWGTTEQDS